MQSSSSRGSDHSDFPREERNDFFPALVEKTFGGELLLETFELFLKRALALRRHFANDDLAVSAFDVVARLPLGDHFRAVLWRERQLVRRAPKHDGADLGGGIFEGEV